MADWSTLGTNLKGLAVEGETDKFILEGFLNAGQIAGYWQDWEARLRIENVSSSNKVLIELEQNNLYLWGLVDRDSRSESELQQLQKDYPKLIILPRWTIENYCINPTELLTLLLPNQRTHTNIQLLAQTIEAGYADWIHNGALWQVMYENGAIDFCRGHERGFPMALLHEPITDEQRISTQLATWHHRLEPQTILNNYHQKLALFLSNPSQHYTLHIHGKNFFRQMVVPALNRLFGQQAANEWLKILFQAPPSCPPDLIPLFQQLLT